jgi:hypothetical protein
VTWPEIVAALLVLLAACLAVDRALVYRTHRPVAAALMLLVFDPARPRHGLAGLLLYFSWPALSAWLAARAMLRRQLLAIVAGVVVLAYGYAQARGERETAGAFAAASVLSVALQATAVAAGWRRRFGVAARCVLVLLAGDVAALLGPIGAGGPPLTRAAGQWIVQWQAALVAGALAAVHIVAAWRPRRPPPAPPGRDGPYRAPPRCADG